MSNRNANPFVLAVALTLLCLAGTTAHGDSGDRHFIVELFDRRGFLVATGRLVAAMPAIGTTPGSHQFEGRYAFDRAGRGAPPLELEGGRLHGRINGDRVQLSFLVFPLERVEMEARFADERRDRLVGEWRYSTCSWFAGGFVRAYSVRH